MDAVVVEKEKARETFEAEVRIFDCKLVIMPGSRETWCRHC